MSYNPFQPYVVEFFNETVESRIQRWPSGILNAFDRITIRMVENGPNLGMPYTRAFGKGLYEIRANGPEGIGRAFFCTVVGRRIVILHGFIKKTQETPAHEIQIARKRQRKIQSSP